MLSNSTPKSSAASGQPKSQVHLVKGRKPLIKYRFYLDVKSHVVTAKIEAKIKDLGGVVELFLIREVTHIVSDRTPSRNLASVAGQRIETPPSTPRTPRTSAYSNDSTTSTVESPFTPSEPPKHSVVKKTHKSRADAMLERVRTHSTVNITLDPLESARQWGTPVWSVDKLLNWLDKVLASIDLPTNDLGALKAKSKFRSTVNVTAIKAPFLKFEPIKRDARPIYQQLPNWPSISLNIDVGESPFVSRNAATSVQCVGNPEKMLRKPRTRVSLRTKLEDTAPVHQHGYCEICRVDYDDLTAHVRSETHLNFVRDDANFLSLDSLITAGANVEAFLRLNGSSKELQAAPYPVFGRRSMRRNNIKSQIEVKINGDAFSPPRKCPSPEKNTMVTPRMTRSSSACEKTTKEVTPAPVSPALSDTGHHLRSRGQLWLPSNLLGTTAEDEGNPVKPPIKENVVKHERETRSSCKDKDTVVSIKEEDVEESDDEQPLIKHIKKNNALIIKQEVETPNNNVKPLANTPRRSQGIRTKRPSADVKLVSDNKAYYKVEVLSSKLRSSGTGNTQRDVEANARVHTPIAEVNEHQHMSNGAASQAGSNDRLVVKFKRVRRSELSVLSNEAENFMFPRRDDSSSEDCDTDEDRNTTQSTTKGESSELKSSESDLLLIKHDNVSTNQKQNDASDIVTDEGSQDCVSAISSCESLANTTGNRKRRRRTHAEVFIADNEKYYKFETPGSRLRFQGSFLPLMSAAHSTPNHTITVKTENTTLGEETEDASENGDFTELPPLETLNYSFERVDSRKVVVIDYSAAAERDFLIFLRSRCPGNTPRMPYELTSVLIPADPLVCREAFEKRMRPAEEGQATDIISETNHSEVNSVADSYDINDDQASSDSKHSHDKVLGRRRGSRRLDSEQNKNPRKSPRQHASTLAILSGLLHQRRRRNDMESGDTPNLTPILEQPENSEVVSACPSPIQETNDDPTLHFDLLDEDTNIVLDIDDRLSASDEDEPDEVYAKREFIQLIETYHKCHVMEDASRDRRYRRSPNRRRRAVDNTSLFSPKGVRRKNRRKNNKTGWPKKRRYLMRRGGDDSERLDTNETITDHLDDSIEEHCEDHLSLDESSSNCSEQGKADIEDISNVVSEIITNKDSNHKPVLDYLKNSNKTPSELAEDTKDCQNNCMENKENSSQPGTSETSDKELDFALTPSRNGSRNPSSDCLGFTAEERVEAEKWENVDNILNAKLAESLNVLKADVEACTNDRRGSIDFQPLVMIEKIDSPSTSINSAQVLNNRRLRSSSSPMRTTQPKAKRVKQTVTRPVSPPISPRKLRKPRGRWYRDR